MKSYLNFVFVFATIGGMTGHFVRAQDATPPEPHPFLDVELSASQSMVGLPAMDDVSSEQLQLARLGRRLFFDPLLSSDGSTSCSTCHEPEHGFSSTDPIAKGVDGKLGRRNAPAILNRHLGTSQFWDGRKVTLEDQALEPISNENELASSVEEVLGKLAKDERYQKEFQAVFKDGLTRDNLAAAIAGFERLVITGDSPIDRFVTAQASVLTRSQRQGLWLYESKGGCWQCHAGQNYTDEKFHNTGVSWGVEPLDLGRFEFTENEKHKGQFKTPTLRNVGVSGPYMHDGSIETLRDVIEFYDRGGNDNSHRDHRLSPLNLSDEEKDDLVAFLEALNGRYVWEAAEPQADPQDPSGSGE